jgi:hypothetical protein
MAKVAHENGRQQRDKKQQNTRSFLCYSPSHMQTRVTTLKFKFLNLYNYFHITVTLHVSTDMVIIRCFEIAVEIAALPSESSIQSILSSMRPCVVVRFIVMGDSSCRIVCSSDNFAPPPPFKDAYFKRDWTAMKWMHPKWDAGLYTACALARSKLMSIDFVV